MLDPKHDAPWIETHRQSFSVSYDYPVYFTRDLFDPANPCLHRALSAVEPEKRHRFAMFVDEGVTLAAPNLLGRVARHAGAHAGRMALAGEIVVVPGGEAVKNQHDCVEHMLRELSARQIDRQSFAVAIGGGAVLDAVGFAAAIFHRGVRHIRCPTTVLAQDDSGVGVKNGINAFGFKNLLGTFAPPFAVINDSAFLDMLPEREKRGGMAEAVKVALIRDADFFHWIEQEADALARFQPNAVDTLVRRCARLHMHQIAHGGDPFETGSARPLDYGHWSAHKLEGLTRNALRHGEAVAIGIALDARYSVLTGLLPEGEDRRVLRLLARLGFTLWDDALDLRDGQNRRRVIGGLADFQEHLGGELTITLLAGVGRGVEVHVMDHALIEQSIRWLKEKSRQLSAGGHAARSSSR
ncbi:MAG: 3-dehydroquinate synthase [Xanthobacteraceae bacterium]|nr:3-dehydroquinate synthase [Xanthobacteraceae bacterium]